MGKESDASQQETPNTAIIKEALQAFITLNRENDFDIKSVATGLKSAKSSVKERVPKSLFTIS